MEIDRRWHLADDVVWTGGDRFDAADIGLPQLASDFLFEGDA